MSEDTIEYLGSGTMLCEGVGLDPNLTVFFSDSIECSSPLCPAGGGDRLFNSPAQSIDRGATEEQEGPSKLPPYSRLT